MNDDMPGPIGELEDWKAAMVADLDRVARRDRWGRALMDVGWVHLAFFLACQALYERKLRSDPRFPVIWLVEVLACLVVLRLRLGRGWIRSSAAAGIVARVWGTFLILAFNVVTLNSLTGWTVNWFKPAWATLSTFGFAMMAWLFNGWFLIAAVQMSVTGMLMVRFPDWNYLIYGVSWWSTLQVLGLVLERRRMRLGQARVEALAGSSREE